MFPIFHKKKNPKCSKKMFYFYISFCHKYNLFKKKKNCFFSLVGGALNLRQHWDHYIEGTQVLIYIIDSSSLDTVNVAKVELWSLVEANKYLETIPWLIIASKQVRDSPITIVHHFSLFSI